MSDGKQLLKSFNSLSQKLKNKYIDKLYNIHFDLCHRKEYFTPRREWEYYFDINCNWYLSKHEDLLNEFCSGVVEEESETEEEEEETPCECCGGFDNNRFYEKSNQIWCEVCADQVSCKECGCWVFEEDTEGGLCGNCVVKMKHEQWNNKHPYTDRDFSISGYCQKCEAKCETIDDILCHYCYHHSLEDNEECWCCNK